MEQLFAAHKTIPMRRLGSGDVVAAAVEYLTSDSASWVTGQTLPVNGGSYAIRCEMSVENHDI